jgi:predicted O-methyltransferase YrrM
MMLRDRISGLRHRIAYLRWNWRRRRNLKMHARTEAIDFNSGLGDSAWLLYGLARSIKPEVCVEIGSARGKSACFIGMALRENGLGKLYAIDPHTQTNWNDANSVDTIQAITRNVNDLGLKDYVEIVRTTSDEAARRWHLPIDLLFIDGDHSYEGVRRDWEAFSRFLTEFGVAVFHDTLWDLNPDPAYYRPDMGVPRLVDELRQEGRPVITINRDYGVSLVQGVKSGVPLRRSARDAARTTPPDESQAPGSAVEYSGQP